MQVVRFLGPAIKGGKGRTQIRQQFGWELLKTKSFSASQSDIRFSLYDGNRDTNMAILIDIDHVSMRAGIRLMAEAEPIFGQYKMYHVFTGGGHHIYIPLETPMATADYRHYRTSYETKLQALAAAKGWLGDSGVSPDPKVFRAGLYGRIPGTLNSKHKRAVTYLGENTHPIASSIKDILEYEHLPDRLALSWSPPGRIINTGGDSVVLKHCGFLKWCEANQDEVPEELWFIAMAILRTAGDHATAHKISSKSKKYDPVKIDAMFAPDSKDYAYACTTVADVSATHCNACASCPHNVSGVVAGLITGPLPTPTRSHKFHRAVKGGYNPRSIQARDVVNQWININEDRLLLHEDMIYRWNEVYWEKLGSVTAKKFPTKILKELLEIPKHGDMVDARHIQDLKRLVKDTTNIPEIPEGKGMDNLHYINFSNGVLDLRDKLLYAHSQEYYLQSVREISYDPNAKCPLWTELCNFWMNPDDQELLQSFAGVLLSSLRPYKYESYLWIQGPPDTGKTLISTTLRNMVGEKASYKFHTPPMELKDGGLTIDIKGMLGIFLEDIKLQKDSKTTAQWETFATMITSSNSVVTRKLYVDPSEIPHTATMIITSNNPPPLSAVQGGGYRRCRMLEIYKKVENKDKDLSDKLMNELPGIINWALDGLYKVTENGLPEIQTNEKALRLDWTEDLGDHIHIFCKEHLEKGNYEDTLSFNRIYTKFLTVIKADKKIWTDRRVGWRLGKILTQVAGRHISMIKRRDAKGVIYRYIKFKVGT